MNNKDGLPENWIHSLLSDGKGGIWVGTTGGLVNIKSDGKWEILTTKNSKLPDNNIYALLSDGNGGLWIGTRFDGLAHFKSNRTWEIFNKDNSKLPDNWIRSLLSDGERGLWIGTNQGGLARLKLDKTWEFFNKDNSELPDNYINAFLSDGSGGIWAGTGGGLAHVKSDGQLEIFKTDNSGLPGNKVSSILSDGKHGLWIGTYYGGLANLKSDRTWEIFKTDNSGLPENTIESLLSDSSGGLWIGTNDKGLVRFKSDGTWNTFQADNSGVSNNWITSLLSDGSGGIWIGTQERGISHFKSDGQWEIFTSSNSKLPHNKVNTMVSDDNGGLWIGTDKGGIAHLKTDGLWEIFNKDNSDLPENPVDSLLLDGQNGLWVGTDGGGLAHLKSDGSWEVFNKDNSGLPSNYVYSILSDQSEGLWIGTYNGLAHLKANASWEVFNKKNSDLPDNDVNSLLLDGSGGLWIGTSSGGLAHLKTDGSWEVLNKDDSGLPSNNVQYLLSNGSDRLWVGTWGGGLAHFKTDGSWEVLNEENSDLPDNNVNSLLSDSSGGLWVGTYSDGLAHLTFSTSQIQEEQYLTGGRAAIIIAGGGNTKDNILWDSTAAICNYTYKMLNRRGFLNTDIHYISPQPFADFNGDGLDDKIVDAPIPACQIQLSDIQAAFDWAKTKGELNQPLYIFFTDHGGKNRLQLAQGVYIEGSELKTMLDDYQQSTGNKVVVVIDASHSGTLLPSLAGSDRAVITSADDGLAYFDRTEDQSFNYFFAKGLFKGMNFFEAFHDAVGKQKKLLGKLSDYIMVTEEDAVNLSQEPKFDDTGDGLYTICDEGKWLKQVSINGNFTNADIPLMVEPVTQSGTISASNNSASEAQVPTILKAKATLAAGRVNRVWAVIRPPQMDILLDNTGVPIMAFPKADLSLSKTEADIYEGSWNGFVYNGEFEITFYAEDNEGNIEGSESIKLTVPDGLACPERGALKVNSTKSSYKSGEKLSVSVTENLAYGYDLYVALFMPDGNFVALKNPLTYLNQLQKENFNRLYWGDRWIETNRNTNMGRAVDVVDIVLSEEILSQNTGYQEKLPQGQYCVYAALIPEGQDLMVSAEKGFIVPERFDGVCFEVVK
ncbi:MAG: hypothetical protein HQK70_05845 [Desulfamplus sp.]|nr:hypothetical protein [Desulfamplus sp.]